MKTIQTTKMALIFLAFICLQTDIFSATLNLLIEEPTPISKIKRKNKKKCKRCMYMSPKRIFKKGQLDGTFSFGILPTFLMDGAEIILPPLSVGLDYRMAEKFSLGFSAGHSISRSRPKVIADGIDAQWTNRFFHLTLRPTMHVVKNEVWDIYGGFFVGMELSDVKGESNSSEVDLYEIEQHLGIGGKRTHGVFSGFVGTRYVIAPKWTLNAELGFGISIFSLGTTYLLNG